jgi:hypothetical protein
MILAWICLRTQQLDTDDLAMQQLSVHGRKPLGSHTKNDKAYPGEHILQYDLAQIRYDLKPIGVRTGAEAMCHVFDRG